MDKTTIQTDNIPLCLLQHYSQLPSHGNNINVHCQMNGLRRCILVHIRKGIVLSHKKNEIMIFAATRIQLWILILSEVNQNEKDKYMISFLYVESKMGHR